MGTKIVFSPRKFNGVFWRRWKGKWICVTFVWFKLPSGDTLLFFPPTDTNERHINIKYASKRQRPSASYRTFQNNRETSLLRPDTNIWSFLKVKLFNLIITRSYFVWYTDPLFAILGTIRRFPENCTEY